jgi:glycosyltransferase A (GT-A) superfamily protein (DUF2064 family)
MCKAPQPGRAKTRLAASVGATAAAKLSSCFLRDVAAAIEAVPERLGRRGYGVYAPSGAEAVLQQLLPPAFGLLLQADDEFGNVLFGATRDLLAAGHDCVLLVNGDSPTLPASFLVDAIGLLRRPGDRMVLGPAADGGYYLIGLKHPHRHLFTGVPGEAKPLLAARCNALPRFIWRQCNSLNGTISMTLKRLDGSGRNLPDARTDFETAAQPPQHAPAWLNWPEQTYDDSDRRGRRHHTAR